VGKRAIAAGSIRKSFVFPFPTIRIKKKTGMEKEIVHLLIS
jgi:hypothetical protein